MLGKMKTKLMEKFWQFFLQTSYFLLYKKNLHLHDFNMTISYLCLPISIWKKWIVHFVNKKLPYRPLGWKKNVFKKLNTAKTKTLPVNTKKNNTRRNLDNNGVFWYKMTITQKANFWKKRINPTLGLKKSEI